jgi:Cytochrome c554 and c-prime
MPASPQPDERRPDAARALRYDLLLVGGVVAAVVAICWGVDWPGPRARVVRQSDTALLLPSAYVGSKSCAECHPGEYASHSRSGHAHTLRSAARIPLARRLSGATFADPERQGVCWTYRLKDGRFQAERHEAEEVEQFLIDYAFGSGRHATTFVTVTDRTPDHPTMFEHRLTVFAHEEAPDITPGQGQARGPSRQGDGRTGRRYATPATLKCFECHTTTMSDRGRLALDESVMIPNIGCERCHGPGRSHIELARRKAEGDLFAMPFGLGSRTGAEEIRLCGSCHRLPETVDPAMIRPDYAPLVRFQPVGLMQSACYQKSQGALSCSTCHDPHARTSTDIPAYEAVCLSCHRGPSKTPCKVAPETGCVGCHMPRRDASRGMMMSDHWIRPRPETAANPSHSPR